MYTLGVPTVFLTVSDPGFVVFVFLEERVETSGPQAQSHTRPDRGELRRSLLTRVGDGSRTTAVVGAGEEPNSFTVGLGTEEGGCREREARTQV